MSVKLLVIKFSNLGFMNLRSILSQYMLGIIFQYQKGILLYWNGKTEIKLIHEIKPMHTLSFSKASTLELGNKYFNLWNWYDNCHESKLTQLAIK